MTLVFIQRHRSVRAGRHRGVSPRPMRVAFAAKAFAVLADWIMMVMRPSDGGDGGHDWPMLMPRINGYLLFVRVIKGMQTSDSPNRRTAIGHRFCPLCCLSFFCSRTLFVVFIKWYFCNASSLYLLLLGLLLHPTNPANPMTSALWPKKLLTLFDDWFNNLYLIFIYWHSFWLPRSGGYIRWSCAMKIMKNEKKKKKKEKQKSWVAAWACSELQLS